MIRSYTDCTLATCEAHVAPIMPVLPSQTNSQGGYCMWDAYQLCYEDIISMRCEWSRDSCIPLIFSLKIEMVFRFPDEQYFHECLDMVAECTAITLSSN